jgi:hypothetical protein
MPEQPPAFLCPTLAFWHQSTHNTLLDCPGIFSDSVSKWLGIEMIELFHGTQRANLVMEYKGTGIRMPMWGIGRLVVAQASKNVPNKVCKIPIVLIFDRVVSTDYRKLQTRFTAEPLRAPVLVFVCISNNGDNSLENEGESAPFGKNLWRLVRSADRTVEMPLIRQHCQTTVFHQHTQAP